MMATHTNKDSKHIMHIIKPDTVGAEIGVWMGNTSTLFLKKGLKKFYMVDAYSVEPYKENTERSYQEYLAKYQPITGEIAEAGFQKFYDRVYEEIKERFKDLPEVKICRMTSDKFFEEYLPTKDTKLDWIYVDGDHSYEGCLRDLENAIKVVKPGGFILGDDYGWPEAKWFKPGVTKAVDEFINKHNLTKMFRHGMTQYEIRI
tara:strand:- start:49 stop:657 length:609 start_codon:yes stop_codon:yes gene_type:complete